MKCVICGKSDEETYLQEGIHDGKIVVVCNGCAEFENIPLIKKPSEEQLQRADEKFSVRERMERLSGLRKDVLTQEQLLANQNLKRMKLPQQKGFVQNVYL